MLLLVLAQVPAVALPDIELHATINADTVRIEQKGAARLDIHASPDAGSGVKVTAPTANGSRVMRNVHVQVDAEARIGQAPNAQSTFPDAGNQPR